MCRFLRKEWFFASLLFLSSCCISLPKHQQTENLITPPCLSESIEESLTTPFFAVGEWPSPFWWEMFNSSELNALIAEALACNPTLEESQRRVEYAKQNAVIERALLFPLITFNATADYSYLSHNGLYRALNPNIPLNANLIDLTLSFNYEFDFWGKNRNLFYAALGEEKAKEAELAQAQLVIATAVAQVYFALKTNLLRKELYEKYVKVRADTFQLQALLEENALLSKLEPLLAEENYLEILQKLEAIDAEIAEDRHLLNILRGVGPDECLAVDAELPPLPEALVLPCDLSLNLIARRPDLMAQMWKAQALAHEVGAAAADFFPNINLAALIGLESVSYSRLFQSHSKTFGITPALSLPIFTAGAIRANVRGKKALFDAAIFEYNALVLQSAQEVADVLTFAKLVNEQKQEQEKVVRNAMERYALTVLRYSKGLNNLINEYRIKEEVLDKQLQEIAYTYYQYLAVIKLIKALGGGYEADCIPLQAEGVCS